MYLSFPPIMEDFFENSIEVQDPFYAKGRLQVALQPIGPAPLGDLKLLVARGQYGSYGKNHSAPHIATLPEVIAFLSHVKDTDETLYQSVLNLPEENPTSDGEYMQNIKSIAKDPDITNYFGMREAAYEGKESGLAIAGNTAFFVDSGNMIVEDDPKIIFDNYKGTLTPHLGYSREDPQKTEGRVQFIKNNGKVRVLYPIKDEDFVMGEWGSGEALVALAGSQELADKLESLDPLTVSPLIGDFFSCSQPRTCVATLKSGENASTYIGGYSDEGMQQYRVFLARRIDS